MSMSIKYLIRETPKLLNGQINNRGKNLNETNYPYTHNVNKNKVNRA